MNMNQSDNLRLPMELLDDIIAITVSTSAPRSKTLSSMALVCQYARLRANEKRFATVYSVSPKRFAGLLSLFRSQSDRKGIHMLSITAFITHVHYRRGQLNPGVPDPFVDGTMSVVLRLLFRPPIGYTPQSKSYILDLDASHERDMEGLDWGTCHPSLTSAFIDLCNNSRLTDLLLFNLYNIPAGILRYSTTLKHLSLDNVGVSSNHFAFSVASKIELQSLHLSGTVLFETVTGLLCGKRPTNTPYLSRIPEMKLTLRTYYDIHITNQFLQHATGLRRLILSIIPLKYSDEDPINVGDILIRYRHLTSLNQLFIFNLFDTHMETAIWHNNVIGDVLPRSLEEINLMFNDTVRSDAVEDTDLLQRIDFNGIDEILSGPQFLFLKRIIIVVQISVDTYSRSYNYYTFMNRCTDYIKSRLPMLYASPEPPFLMVRLQVI